MMTIELQLTGARADDTAENIILSGKDSAAQSYDVRFNEETGDNLLAAFVTVLGHRARQRTKDSTLKRVLPVEWWEINPHPAKDGMLFSFRLPGGMEMTFHIGAGAVPRFEEVLTTLTGTRPTAVPDGPKN